MQHQQRQINGINDSTKIVEDNSQQSCLQFVLPQAPDKMNQQAQHVVPQLRGGPGTTGNVPFYNYRTQNPGPQRHGIPSNAAYTTPTLTLQQGSSIVQNSQIGSHPQLYTVYMNGGNGTSQNLQNRPSSVPQQQYQFQPGQEVVHPQQFPPQQFYQSYQANPPGAAGFMMNPAALFQPTPGGNWAAIPQQMLPYPQQASVYGSAATSTMVHQPPPTAVPSHVQQTTATLPKRERHPLVIVDPTTQKNVIEEAERERRMKEENFSKESTSSSTASGNLLNQTINYQQQGTPAQQMQQQYQQQQQNTNYYNPATTTTTNVHYQKSSSSTANADAETNSQTNSRGHTPLSPSVTPTDTHQNYSPGPPAAPNIGGGGSSSSLTSTTKPSYSSLPPVGQQNEQDAASQKVYCELALNIARQTCGPSTTPPPPSMTATSATSGGQDESTSNDETPSASQASITLNQKSSSVVSSPKIDTTTTTKSFAAAASASQAQSTSASSSTTSSSTTNERRAKEILSTQNNELGVEKSSIDVSFGFFEDNSLRSDDGTTTSNDDTLKTTAHHEQPTASVDENSPLPTSTSTPVKDENVIVEERKMNEKSPTPVKEPPTFRVTTPLEDGQNLNKQKYVGRNSLVELSTLTEHSTKSTDADASLEEGEIKENAYENVVNALRALRTPEIWSVDNPDGKLVWSRELMMAIGQLPMSKSQPECLASSVRTHDVTAELFSQKRGAIASSPRDSKINRGSTDGRTNFQPSWQQHVLNPITPKKFTGRGSTGGGGGRPGGNRPSGGQGGGGGNKPQLVIPRASASLDVQLKKAEHAWLPKLKQKTIVDDPEKAKTEELYRKVKSILNKITPQTFDDLSEDLMALEPEMNTSARTSGVIDIVFQKVCDEPGFCETYGRLCEMLSVKQTRAGEREKTETFRYQLLTKCQQNFEMDKNTERLKEQKLAEIENAETEELKKQMNADLEETLAKNKWRTLGSIRFVGELYKRKLLTKFIAQYCVQHLLSKQNDEESIECLCKFLTTIGKTLEEDNTNSKLAHATNNIQFYFEQLQEIVDTQQVSKRIQFEIKNLVELRENKWIPRRKEAGPKKIDEIHLEAKMEENQQRIDIQQRQNNQQLQPRGSQQGPRGGQQHRGGVPSRGSYNNEDDYERRRGGGGGRPGDRDRNAKDRQVRENVRAQVTANLSQETRHIDSKSLSKHLNAPVEEVSLGPKRWAQKTQGPTGAVSTAAKTNNRFQQLSDDGRRDSAPSSRESSQTRISSSVSDRQAALDAASSLGGRRQPTSPETPSTMSREASPNRPYSAEPAERDDVEFHANDDKFKRFSLELFDEYVTSGLYEEAERLVAEKKPYFVNMMQFWLENVIEKTSKERFKLGELMARLISKNIVPLDAAVNGFNKFVQMIVESEMETDVPLVWPYLGEVLGAVIVNRGSGGSATLRLGDFHSAFQSAGQKSHDLLAHTLLTVQSASSEQNLRDVWANESWSKYKLNNPNEVDDFLKKHNIKCLSHDVSSSTSVQNGSVVNNNDRVINSIDPNLVDLERYVKSMDPVVDPEQLIIWIEANVTNKTSEEFVRALARSFCSKVFLDLGDGDYNLNEDNFDNCCRVFQRYLTGIPESEVTLLLELAKFYYDRGCPRDILARMFGVLSDGQVIPRESFMEWWRLERETNTHGMILKNSQINRFIDSIKQQDQDGDSSAGESSDEKTTPDTVIDAKNETVSRTNDSASTTNQDG